MIHFTTAERVDYRSA